MFTIPLLIIGSVTVISRHLWVRPTILLLLYWIVTLSSKHAFCLCTMTISQLHCLACYKVFFGKRFWQGLPVAHMVVILKQCLSKVVLQNLWLILSCAG